MSSTYRIHGARFLRKYSADERSSIYAYMSDVRRIADTLCKVPWQRVVEDVPATMTLHTEDGLDWNAPERDRFDAAEWCAEHADGMHRAYAQAACYVFEIPANDIGKTIEKIAVTVTSDPYNPYGARISALTSDTLEIPMPCADCREGEVYWRDVDSETHEPTGMGAAPRLFVENEDGTQTWYANIQTIELAPGSDNCVFRSSGSSTGSIVAKKYLFVFCILENYNRGRNGWIEGCSYIENDVAITLASASSDLADGELNDLAPERDYSTLLAGGSSPTWLEPPVMLDVGATAPEVPAGDAVKETFFAELPLTSSSNTVRNSISVPYVFKFQSTLSSGTYQWTGSVKLDFNGASLESGTHDYVLANVSGQDSLTISDGTIDMWTNGDPATTQSSQYRTLSISYGVALNPTNGTMVVTVNLSPYLRGYLLTPEESSGLSFISDALVYMPTASESGALYLMLKTEDGVPVEADISSSADESGRLRKLYEITAPGSGETHYTIDVGNYNGVEVWFDSETNEVKATFADKSWSWRSYANPSGSGNYFDAAAVAVRTGEAMQYGLAAACGDFSSAVATFEPSETPSDTEVLGRLIRLSKEQSGGMASLHPATAALTGELDAMRPVPRFLRGGSAPEGAIGQPGLSAWYCRPSGGSTAALGYTIGDNNATVAAGVVAKPAFLQIACLALRSPAEIGEKLVLENVDGAAVNCDFKLRFVAWRSKAGLWDKSNSFALAALGSMPSIYTSEGSESVQWSVDMAGSLFPFGTRQVSAQRVGVSETVDAIAAGAKIEIPLTDAVGEGDVILIAPEVVGFKASSSANAYFGLTEDPSEADPFVWAREAYNIGWFPKVYGR